MYERDMQRLEEDLQEGVKLAESLGLDVSGVELPATPSRGFGLDGNEDVDLVLPPVELEPGPGVVDQASSRARRTSGRSCRTGLRP